MKKILFSIGILVFAFVGMSLYSTPSAKAALDGDNGRILYTDSTTTETNKQQEEVNQVITTGADGTGDVVAATTVNGVETATISAPDATGNSTIVYSEQAKCLNNDVYKLETNGDYVNPCTGDNPNELSQVSLSKVTIDANGNPITAPENVVTFAPLIDGVPTYNSISEVSISPDSVNVLVTRTSSPTYYTESLWGGNTGENTPGIFTENSALELGVKFESSIDGYITGANIYVPECSPYDSEGLLNTSCGVSGYTNYDVNLWTKNGLLLSSVADYYVPTYYQSSQWQYIPFVEPVEIKANKTYVISYSPDNNRYAATNNYFTSKYVNGTLTALKSKEDSGNGVYTYSPGNLPTNSFNATNYWIDPIFQLYSLTTIENVNIETGEVTTIVAPRIDRLVAGGYAQNGNIYFSRTNSKNGSPFDSQSNIWVIEAGQTEAVKLTTTPNISEFYIDASPDNSVLLVADVSSKTPTLVKGFMGYCNYPQNKYHYYTECDYFYISTTDGSREKLKKLADGFVPVFFSPDGNYLIGTLYPARYYECGRISLLQDSEEFDQPATAIVARNNLKLATIISENRGVQEWAPVAVAPVVTPSTPIVGPTLPNTGINASSILVAIVAVMFAASASVVTGFAIIKK